MMENKVAAPAGTQAALRAIRVLKAFTTERPELTLTEMCGAVALTKTTTHRLLNALMSEGLVERDNRSSRYRLGTGVLALAASMISGRTLISAVHPVLETLAHETGETASLEILADGAVLILDEVSGNQLLTSSKNIGTRWPLHATSTGKVFLACSRDWKQMLKSPLQPLTPHTITDLSGFSEVVESVKATGYATASNELENGYSAVAAPIRGTGGAVCGALSIGGPASRLDQKRLDGLGVRLKEAAAALVLA